MTFMQRVSLWAAKRYLKVQHFRMKGWAGDTVFATGDVLMSPNAIRYFHTVDKEPTFEWEMYEVKHTREGFRGISPPNRIKSIREKV